MGLYSITAGLKRYCRRLNRRRVYRSADGASVSVLLVALSPGGVRAIVGRVEHELVLVLYLHWLGVKADCPQV